MSVSSASSGSSPVSPDAASDTSPPPGIDFSPSPTSSTRTEHTPLLSVQVVAASQHAATAPTPSNYVPAPALFKLERVRWYILGLFSLMALFNQTLCYTFASVNSVSHEYFHGTQDDLAAGGPFGFGMSTLVSCYFITYIIFSFPTAWFIEKWGFRAGVICGAWLQAIGCLVRVLATPSIDTAPGSGEDAISKPHGSLGLLIIGQLIVSLGQAFFVNPPPLLAATWFGVDERVLATTIAVNANTLGIAVAYLAGPALVTQVSDLPRYVFICFVCTFGTAVLSSVYFPSGPNSPPSHSQSVDPLPESLSPSPEATAQAKRLQSNYGATSSDRVFLAATESPLDVDIDVSSSEPNDSDEDDSSSEVEDEEQRIDLQGAVNGARPVAPLSDSAGRSAARGHSHHVRAKTPTELALEAHYNAMASPPCAFVVSETIAAERERSRNSHRLIGSWHVFKRMFAARGFLHTLLVFGIAEATINALSAFMHQIMSAWGYTSAEFTGFVVCAMIGAMMVGSAVVGYAVDKSKAYKTWMIVAMLGAAASLLYLIHAGPLAPWHIWIAVLSLGFWIGPIQPLSIETGVEVTYPSPESSVTAVQQVLGNIFSAALFPLVLLFRDPVTHSMTPALYLMVACLIGTAALYCTFSGEYRRIAHEASREHAHRDLHRRLHARDQAHAQALIDQLNAKAQPAGVAIAPIC